MLNKAIFFLLKKIVWLSFAISKIKNKNKSFNFKAPNHVAIIMDGNGRWAKKRLFPRSVGHYAGMLALRNIIWESKRIGIKQLTLYAFSTENWKRPEGEVGYLTLDLPQELFKSNILSELNRKNIKVIFMGETQKLPKSTVKLLDHAMKKTESNNGMIVNFALNYGGRSDITQAVKNCIKNDIENVTEENIAKHLYTNGLEDPHLVIRTGGDLRISNFLLWQIAHSELWFTEKYWPSFNQNLLIKAISEYNLRFKVEGN